MFTNKAITVTTLEINPKFMERLPRIGGKNAKTQVLTTAIFKRSPVKIVK